MRHLIRIMENGKPSWFFVEEEEFPKFEKYCMALWSFTDFGDTSYLEPLRGMAIIDDDGITHYPDTDPQKIAEALEALYEEWHDLAKWHLGVL